MSGGFFRGTSADQDTRFSNKQAKLLKSQKFAPELENLVDITKVKMDVMRPWIAHRVTELLGFEDEVLINFIYGLLEGKEVNGKEIQIQLTGFMEKNTGRFMKELWSLLLSAQKNASGVPQQFLDAKEEETKKKMAETERITNEIQKRKEKESQERELERMKKMDVEAELSRANNAAVDLKHQPSDSNTRSADDKEINGRNSSRGRSRVSRSPHSAERSLSPPRRRPSRSVSNSISNSRSRSNERHRSRSKSQSPQKRSVSPRYRRRSPSPVRRRIRSPIRRRSRSPIGRRSRSPIRRRSRPPIRYRSRTPIRRRSRSPVRPRSPSPGRRRSPSPVRRRYRRSPSTPRRRSVSPVRRRPTGGGGRRRSPTPPRRGGSRSPQEFSSQSPPRRTPPSPKRQRRSPMPSPRDRIRALEKRSPVRRAPPRDNVEHPVETRKGSESSLRRPPVSLRSPQRDLGNQNGPRRKMPALSPSPYKSPSLSESPPPPADRKRSPSKDRRLTSPYESPVKQTKARVIRDGSPSPPRKLREHKPIHDTREARVEDEEASHSRDEYQKFKSSDKRSIHSSITRVHKDSAERVHYKDKYSPETLTSHRSSEAWSRRDNIDSRKKDQDTKSEKISEKERYPEVRQQEPPTTLKGTLASERVKEPYLGEGDKGDVKGSMSKLAKKVEQSKQFGSLDSGSEESNDKRKHKKSKRHEVTSDDDYSDDDSQIEGKKEAKKRRKEEKRLKKEERRRRREERRRRREERRSEKIKLKTAGAVALGSHSSDVEETESEQKKLEIELREKALESLRARKGSGN